MFNKQVIGALVLVSVCAAPLAYAEVSEDALVQVQSTVMDMLQSETKIAAIEQLERERKAMGLQITGVATPSVVGSQQPLMTPPDSSASAEPEKPKVKEARVLGIWGLGDNLTADVRIEGKTLRFQRGVRYPRGYGADSPYTLIAIKTPCVKYAEQGVAQTLCIDGLPAQ